MEGHHRLPIDDHRVPEPRPPERPDDVGHRARRVDGAEQLVQVLDLWPVVDGHRLLEPGLHRSKQAEVERLQKVR